MSGIVGMLNQPAIKQGIKNAIGVGICGMGAAVGAKTLYDKYTKHIEKTENYSIEDRVGIAFAQFSLLLSVMVTPQGVWALSHIVSRIFSSAQLEKVFGPNTVFEANWKHPRHVASFAAVALAIPLVAKRLNMPPITKEEGRLQICALVTIIFSRPFLHQANLLAQRLLRSIK